MPKNQIEAEIEYVLSAAIKKCGDLHEAIRQGVHPRDLGYICPKTIAVFD